MGQFGRHEGVGNAHEGVGNAEGLGFCRCRSDALLLLLLSSRSRGGGSIQSLLKQLLMLLGSQSLVEGRLQRARGEARCHGGRGEAKILGGPATHGGEVGRRGRGRTGGSHLAATVAAVVIVAVAGQIVVKVNGARRFKLLCRYDKGVKVGAKMIAKDVGRRGPCDGIVVGVVVVVGVIHALGGICVRILEVGPRYDGNAAGFALALGRRGRRLSDPNSLGRIRLFPVLAAALALAGLAFGGRRRRLAAAARLGGLGGGQCRLALALLDALGGGLAADVEETSEVGRRGVIDVGAGAHLALAGDLLEAKVVELPLEARVLGVAEVLAQHLGLHGGGIVNDDPAGVPLDEVVVGRIGQHAGEMEEKLRDGTAGGRLGLVPLEGGGGGCCGSCGFEGCVTVAVAHGCGVAVGCCGQ